MLIENARCDHMRQDSTAPDRLTAEETMLEVGMLSTFNAIMQQSSEAIYDVSNMGSTRGGGHVYH